MTRSDLLLTCLVGVTRYIATRQSQPQASNDERIRDACLFACGSALGENGTRALVRRGHRPWEAGTMMGAASLVSRNLVSGTALESVADGMLWGTGIGTLGSQLFPQWALGVRPRMFVSHAFAHTDEYIELKDKLIETRLSYYDHSVPVYEQFPTQSKRALRRLLRQQIRGTSVVVLLAGPGVDTRPCVRDELVMAMRAGKPILVIDQDAYGRSSLPAFVANYPLVHYATLDDTSTMLRELSKALLRRGNA